MNERGVLGSTALLLGLFALYGQGVIGQQIEVPEKPPAMTETREENARRLITQANEFKLKVRQFHSDANKQIDDAKKLKGQADQLRMQLNNGSPEYKAALNQYNQDISQFKSHADLYNQHMAAFEKTMGQCHADEAQYQAHLKDVQLHLTVFHMPDIKPPHICKGFEISSQEAAHYSNSLKTDQMRIVEAETALNKSENKLQTAEQASALTSKQAANAAFRDQKEGELAGEFGKLREEYKMLDIERQAIGGNPATVATSPGTSAKTSVSAKIRK